MADLSNLKIKNTYQNLLQVDGGVLKNLLGNKPTPFIIGGGLRYDDGNQLEGYVMRTNNLGDAYWGPLTADIHISAATLSNTILKLHTTSGKTISVPVSYWSTDGNGNYANSGLTGNIGIGTSAPNKKLTVVGDISGTTDLYLGSATHTSSTITAQDELIIKGNGLNDYVRVSNDYFGVWVDGAQEFVITPTDTTFNASARAVDFSVYSEDSTALIRTRAEHNIVRLLDHVSINKPLGWNWEDEQRQALIVSGTSVFYSGGTAGTNKNAIEAIGNVSVTADLHIAGDTHTTNLILGVGGYIMPAVSNETIKFRAQTYDGEMASIGEDLFNVNMNSQGNFQISPTQVTFNVSNIDQDFRVMSDTGNFSIQTNAEFDLLAIGNGGGTSIGGTTSRWPTANGFDGNVPIRTLQVNGITTIYSGGTGMSWSADTTALTVVGNTNIRGTVTASNLSGINTGDQDLSSYLTDTDIIDGGTF